MLQESEIITLFLGVIGLLIAQQLFQPGAIVAAGGFKAVLLTLIAAYIFTVLEGYWLNSLFNHLEHICYAVSAWLFAWAVIQLTQEARKSNPSP